MDWKDLGPVLGASAPLLGKLVSIGVSFIPGVGPIAGPIIGPAVGAIIAKQFGVTPTPDAVAQAVVNSSPAEVEARLRAATEETKAIYHWAEAVETGKLRLEEVQLTQVNETARAELQVESPFKTWWRPFNGWVLGVENALVGSCAVACLVLAMLGNDQPLTAMRDAWPLLLAVLGCPAAVVGVAVWQRSTEKLKAMEVTGQAPLPGKPTPLDLKSKIGPTPTAQVAARISAQSTRPSPGPLGPLPLSRDTSDRG